MYCIRDGFTIIELLVSLALITVVVGLSVTGFQSFARYQQYDQETALLYTVLADTKADARVSEGGESHGVKFFSDHIVVFSGTPYSGVDPDNETITFNNITLTHALTGGANEVIFSTLTGLPSATGTVSVTGIDYNSSQTIEITEAGVIQ
jgi:prepilin-type N-terminal cleavage/methylation domain-containing protein